jgi:V8-like Glu-specific endopeptidase
MRLHNILASCIAVACFFAPGLAVAASVLPPSGAVNELNPSAAQFPNAPPEIMRSIGNQSAQSSRLDISDRLPRPAIDPFEKLGSARVEAKEKLRQLQEWNRGENIPTQIGFTRALKDPAKVSFDPEARQLAGKEATKLLHRGMVTQSSNGEMFWTATVDAEEAHQLRLHLQADTLADDVQMWVYGDNGDYRGPFGAELMDSEGGLWTPSVSGSRISLVVQLSSSAKGITFNIDKVGEIFQLDASGEPVFEAQEALPNCLQDAQCFDATTYPFIEETEASVAIIRFAKDDSFFQCTGGLIADTDGNTQIPYFLTANHCLKTQASADSLEAFWDYKTNVCNGTAPNLYSVPRSNGSTLLATGSVGDYTLLRLDSVPAGRWFMGWDSSPNSVSAGAILHRISYPGGQPQSYSQSSIGQSKSCGTSFIHQTNLIGAQIGGSSGSPVFLGNGKIVGQLFGSCGTASNPCAFNTYQTIDGALSVYYSAVAQWLSPPVAPGIPQNVSASDGVDTFKVRITWSDLEGEDHYEVYRCTTSSVGSCGAAIVSTAANATSFDDTGAAADGTVHYYRLKACNNMGCSGFSAADSGFRKQTTNGDELINISTRADVRTGDNITIGGFIITGNAQKCVVVQGLGPSVGVPGGVGRLPDPILSLKSGGTTIAQNDNWLVQDNPADAATIQNLGIPFVPKDLLESAIYKCLNPGGYTALVSGYLNTTGIGMVAVYDADDGTPYLSNISTRSWVGNGDLISIGGFVIAGSEPRQVLIRGRGPSMQGLLPPSAQVLMNPQLRLFQGSQLLAENDDWGSAPNAGEISALPSYLRLTDPRESAILMVLQPGAYTAHLWGTSGSTGIGQIAVDDLTGR